MHIDSLAIQLSGAVGIRRGSSVDPLIDQKDVIQDLHDVLTSVGWSSAGIKAKGTIFYPFGFPTISGISNPGPKRVIGCGRSIVFLDGTNYVWYDPFNEAPAANADCVFFALATTAVAGLTNLASAIGGRYLAALTDPQTITVTAINVGPSFNFPEFTSDGEWGIHTDISGGGYTLTSVENRDTNNLLRSAQYSIKVTAHDTVNRASNHVTLPIWFDFQSSFNGFGSVLFAIDTWIYPDFAMRHQDRQSFGAAGYVIVGNPYSFAIFCPDASATGIFACAPYIPTEEDFTSATALFVVAPFMNPSKGTWWDIGYGVTLNSAMVRVFFSGTSGYPRMLAMRSPGTTPLLTPSGTPLITNAWVMFGANPASTPYVVGKLWDCAMVNDMVTVGMLINGSDYIPLGYQDGSGAQTRSSIVFRVN